MFGIGSRQRSLSKGSFENSDDENDRDLDLKNSNNNNNNNNGMEIEMEHLLGRSSSSGNMLQQRSSGRYLSHSTTSADSNNRSSAFRNCETRGQRNIARVSSGIRKNLSRRSLVLVTALLGLIAMSVLLNALEGSMLSMFAGGGGRSESKAATAAFEDGQPLSVAQAAAAKTNGSPHRTSTTPAVAPRRVTAPPILPFSAHDHTAGRTPATTRASSLFDSVTNQTTMDHPGVPFPSITEWKLPPSYNSFTTWLNFDDKDSPVRKNHPKPGNGDAFRDKWCDLTGTTWYPTTTATPAKNSTTTKGTADTSWQLRAPLALLPGASYSGVAFLTAALHTHPSVAKARTKELQFFHEGPFRRYIHSRTEKTLVHAARARMYARDYDTTALQQKANLVSVDASPHYLFHSALLPRRILCVAPWIRLVVVLRNPVDRVLEHYAASVATRGLKLSLEEWIAQDLQSMQRAGLIPSAVAGGSDKGNEDLPSTEWNNTSSFSGSKQEDMAWYDYQSRSVEAPLGRSLYVIQIRQWVQALRTAGKSPADQILLLRTDHMALDPAREVTRVLDFLELSSTSTSSSSLTVPLAVSHQTRPVHPETRQFLEEFYAPHNRRLKALLRLHGIVSEATVATTPADAAVPPPDKAATPPST